MRKSLVVIGTWCALLLGAGALCLAQEGAQAKNPFQGNGAAIAEAKEIFSLHCGTCHGEDAKGNMCPDLTVKAKRYGNADADLFLTISKGRPGGMPHWGEKLGTEKIWKLIAFLRSVEED